MDSRDWEIIRVIFEKSNITKAAEALFLSQPTLTYRLNKIESEFGVTIVNRHSNGISFTREGLQVVEFCRKMLNEEQDFKRHLTAEQEKNGSSLAMGVSTVFSKYYLADILEEYKRTFPDVKIDLTIGTSSQKLPALLRDNQVDLIIVRGDPSWEEAKHIIHSEPYGIVALKGFTLDQLTEKPWIQYEPENFLIQSGVFFLEWWKSRRNENFQTEIIKMDSNEAALNLTERGIGWTVMPEIHSKKYSSLSFFPLEKKDGSCFLRNTWLLYKNHSRKKTLILTFLDIVKKRFTNI